MCVNCDWDGALGKMKDILNTGSADESAVEFVEDVHTWVEENKHVTEAQFSRIKSIADEVGA